MKEHNVIPMNGEYGIQETTEAIVGVGTFVSKLDEALEDGKFDIIDDSLLMAPTLGKLFTAIKGGDQIPKEVGDLDPEERALLNAAIMEHFDLNKEQAEKVAEAGMRWLVASTDLAYAIKGL